MIIQLSTSPFLFGLSAERLVLKSQTGYGWAGLATPFLVARVVFVRNVSVTLTNLGKLGKGPEDGFCSAADPSLSSLRRVF